MSANIRRTFGIEEEDDMLGLLTSQSGYIYDINNDEIIKFYPSSYGETAFCRGKSMITPIINYVFAVKMDDKSDTLDIGTDLSSLTDSYNLYRLSYYLVGDSDYDWSESDIDYPHYIAKSSSIKYSKVPIYEDSVTGFKFAFISSITSYTSNYSGLSSLTTHVYQVNDSFCISSYISSYSAGVSIENSSGTDAVHRGLLIGVYNNYAYLGTKGGNMDWKLCRFNYKTGSSSYVGGGSYFTDNGNENIGGISLI